jgi:hypothetical protein
LKGWSFIFEPISPESQPHTIDINPYPQVLKILDIVINGMEKEEGIDLLGYVRVYS